MRCSSPADFHSVLGVLFILAKICIVIKYLIMM